MTHIHFDFTTPTGLKITPSDETKKTEREREEQAKEDKRVEEKKD